MEKNKFSVTRDGEPLDPNLYTWNEYYKTFTTDEDDLVLDFSGIDNVTFHTWANNIIKCGKNCVWENDWVCNGNIELDHSQMNMYERQQSKIVHPIGYISEPNMFNIVWWKNELNVTIIKVGCQIHSLDYWKKNYLEIAKLKGVNENLIPTYLQHLNTIESSLKV